MGDFLAGIVVDLLGAVVWFLFERLVNYAANVGEFLNRRWAAPRRLDSKRRRASPGLRPDEEIPLPYPPRENPPGEIQSM